MSRSNCNCVCPMFTSKLFLHKLLLTLQFLQGCPRYKQGATLRIITAFMKKNFITDGDIRSQIKSSLKESVHHGFVEKKGACYVLIVPAANIVLTPHDSPDRKIQCNRSKKIFNLKWNNSSQKSKCLCVSEKVNVIKRLTDKLTKLFRTIVKDKHELDLPSISSDFDCGIAGCVGEIQEGDKYKDFMQEIIKDCDDNDEKEGRDGDDEKEVQELNPNDNTSEISRHSSSIPRLSSDKDKSPRSVDEKLSSLSILKNMKHKSNWKDNKSRSDSYKRRGHSNKETRGNKRGKSNKGRYVLRSHSQRKSYLK